MLKIIFITSIVNVIFTIGLVVWINISLNEIREFL